MVSDGDKCSKSCEIPNHSLNLLQVPFFKINLVVL